MTPAEEEGWTSIALPVLCLFISITFLIRFSLLLQTPILTLHLTRILKFMLFWSGVRTAGFLFRSVVGVFPESAGGSVAFVATTKVFLAVGGAPLSRCVTKNTVSAFVFVKSVGGWEAWKGDGYRRKVLDWVQRVLDAVLVCSLLLIIVGNAVQRSDPESGFHVGLRVGSWMIFWLNVVPALLCLCGLWFVGFGEVEGGERYLLKKMFLVSLVQSGLLIIKYIYQTIDTYSPDVFHDKEAYFYFLSVLPEFLFSLFFCINFILLMFQFAVPAGHQAAIELLWLDTILEPISLY